MKRKRQSIGRFVMVPYTILDAPAWRAMDFIARLLWIELRRKLRSGGENNGKIYCACRPAAKAIGANKETIAHRYAELEHYGFLRKTSGAYLGLDGRGIAPHYRFTDLAHGTHPPTRDYEKWTGELFVYTPRRQAGKKQNPVRRHRTPCPTAPDIQKVPEGGSVCPAAPDIDGASKCPAAPDISRIAIWHVSAEGGDGRLQGSLTVRAPAQAGGAGSSPAPVASRPYRHSREGLTGMVLGIVHEQLDELGRMGLEDVAGKGW